MKVSVVVTCFNYGTYLAECLESILAQTYRDFDVIVIDDGSTDDTPLVVVPFLCDPRVRYHRQANQGQASAKNAGIRLTNGDLVAFLDADDLWEPTKLERQVPLFSNLSVGVVYCGGRDIDPVGTPLPIEERTGYLCFRRGWITKWLGFENIVPFSSTVVRRTLLDAHGAFDESLTMGIDWDLWLRLSCDTEFDFVPDRLFIYRLGHANQMSRNLNGRIEASEHIFQRFIQRRPDAFSRSELRDIQFYNSCRRAYAFRGVDTRRSRAFLLRAWKLRPWSYVPYAGLARNAIESLKASGS